MTPSTNWTGGDNGSWDDGKNWSSGAVPATGTIAVVAMPTATAVSESFGANEVTYDVTGPVYSDAIFDNEVVAIGDTPTTAIPGTPSVNFVAPGNAQQQVIGAGATIAEISTIGEVNFLGAGIQPYLIETAATLASLFPGGTLEVEAQSDSFTVGTLYNTGLWAAASGGTLDVEPNLPLIAVHDSVGNSSSFAPSYVINAGVIEAAAKGTVILEGGALGVVNPGTIMANGGDVIVNTGITEDNGLIADTGPGSLYVLGGGTIDTATANVVISEPVVFEGNGTLVLTGNGGALASVSGVQNFLPLDTIDLPGEALSGLSYNGTTLSFTRTTGGQSFAASEAITTSVAAPNFIVTPDGSGITLACFRRATRIATDTGDCAVEALAVGQQVRTAAGSTRPIRWIGRRQVDCRRHPEPARIRPVRIAADAFAPGIPHRDLYLSPDHAVFTDGVLIPVMHLINGRTIAQIETDTVEYWHVELDTHDVLLAENLPVESYLDTGNRMSFEGGDALHLHADFTPRSWDQACAELVEHGPRLVAVKRRLFTRAGTPPRPLLGLELIAGHPLTPGIPEPGLWHYAIPAGHRIVHLHAPTWMPAACQPDSLDRRILGVRLFEIRADGRPIDTVTGCHAAEDTAEGPCRWTTGEAVLTLPPGTRDLTLRIGDGAIPLLREADPMRAAS